MAETHAHESSARTFTWLIVMIFIILFKGLMAFFVVSDMGQPTWAFRPVNDVPASSPYAKYQRLPYQQHVRGEKGE